MLFRSRLNDVLGVGGTATTTLATATVKNAVDDDVPFENPKPVAKKAAAPVVEDDEDEDLAMFRKLAED